MTSDSQLMDSRDVDSTEENENAKEDVAEQWEKGYDLPIDEPERKEAEDECKMILELISDIYTRYSKYRLPWSRTLRCKGSIIMLVYSLFS